MRIRTFLAKIGKITPIVFLGLIMFAVATPPAAKASIGIVVTIAPEPLPVYYQPLCPGPGYIWAPGYWAWGPDGYFWVPGTWVLAPFPGALWTPGYWAWDPDDGGYVWNEGYWATEVGFYGGIVYGFGYTGIGYEGGYWQNGAFFYNRSVNNVSTTNITNVYNRTVVNNVTVNNVSFNGGNGGTAARPTPAQIAVAHGRRVRPTDEQRKQVEVARADPSLLVSANHGRPPVAATPRPGALKASGAVPATGAGVPARRPSAETQTKGGFQPFHPNPKQSEKPARAVNPAAPEMGNPHGNPERPGRMEPAPRTQPAARGGTEKPANRPPKPEKEKPQKEEKHGPPHDNRASNFSQNRETPRPSAVQGRGASPRIAARKSVAPPVRTAPHAVQPENRVRRPEPSTSAHTDTEHRKNTHPPTGGR